MLNKSERLILDSKIFKIFYFVTVGFLVLMCAVSTNLWFASTINFTFVAGVAVVYSFAVVVVSKRLERKSYDSKLKFYSLTSAFLCTYSFSIYIYIYMTQRKACCG